MRVGIEALEFDQFGGGQIVSVEFIRILQELGHHVLVFCNKNFTRGEILAIRKKWRLQAFENVYVPDLKNGFLNSVLFSLIQIKYHLDCYFSVGLLILSKYHSKKIPTFRYALAPHTPFLFKKYRNLLKYGKIVYFFFRIAELFFNQILDTAGKHAKTRLVLSNFIKSLYQRAYDVNYTILYPPVYQDDLYSLDDKDERTIVCLGRVDEQKNYPIVVKLAERYPDLCFHIIGGYTPTRTNQRLYRFLINASRKLSNLKIEINVPRTRIAEVLARNRYLLHTMRDEHFGIAIVEALKSGMTPIVARNSGPEEIVANGKYGHVYNDLTHLVNNFKDFLVPFPPQSQIERAQAFHIEKFRKNARQHIDLFFRERIKPKKALHIGFLGAWPPDTVGEARYDKYLIETSLRNYKDVEYDLVCEKYTSVPEPVNDTRLRVHHIFNPRDILYPVKIFFKFLSWRPHIVHIQFGPNSKQYGGVLGEPMLLLLFFLRIARIPSILTLHTAFLRSQAGFASSLKYKRLKISWLTSIVFLIYTKTIYGIVNCLQLSTPRLNSKLKALFLKDYSIDGKKLVEIPHPCFPGKKVPYYEARSRLGIKDDVFCILSFGFIAKRKGYLFLVKAADILKNKSHIEKFLMIIAGRLENPSDESYLKEMQAMILERGLSEHVRIIPKFLPFDELPFYFSAADIFVFPYVYTAGVSGALHSVVYQEKPIIITNSGLQFKESINNSLILVPPGNEVELAKKIQELKENRTIYNKLVSSFSNFYLKNNIQVWTRRVFSSYISLMRLKWNKKGGESRHLEKIKE
ncbi:MAG: glycosyltransferase family 4 protein [Candidatus Sigynarchaeota archaeon]